MRDIYEGIINRFSWFYQLERKMQLPTKDMMINLTLQFRRFSKSPVTKYSAINIVAKVFPVLVIILLAELLEPSQYGLIALLLVCSTVLSSLINYGFPLMVSRESHMCNKQEFGELMSSSWTVSLMIFFLVLIGVILFYQPASWLGLKQEWLVIAVVLGLMLGRIDVFSKYLVAQQQVRAYSILEFFKTVTPALTSIFLVYAFLDHAVMARISGLLVGASVSISVAYYIIRKRVVYQHPSKEAVNRILVYGTQVLPQAISNWIKLGADKVIIGNLLGLEVLGAYFFTFSICSLFMVFVTGLNNAYLGPCMSMYKQADLEGIANLRKRYIVMSTVLLVICTAAVQLLPLIYWPDGYKVSPIVISFLMLSFWSQVIYLLYAKYFMFSLKMSELSYVNLSTTIIYVFGLLLVEPGELELEYVALYFLAYNFFIATYAVLRVTYAEKKLV
ncbi:oligosaccharide flippase family protein [Gammaproteobacteria bacterium]|nr:oligosaccharide flippase family protein [Gammaproteobacteria bacterium]